MARSVGFAAMSLGTRQMRVLSWGSASLILVPMSDATWLLFWVGVSVLTFFAVVGGSVSGSLSLSLVVPISCVGGVCLVMCCFGVGSCSESLLLLQILGLGLVGLVSVRALVRGARFGGCLAGLGGGSTLNVVHVLIPWVSTSVIGVRLCCENLLSRVSTSGLWRRGSLGSMSIRSSLSHGPSPSFPSIGPPKPCSLWCARCPNFTLVCWGSTNCCHSPA